MVSSASTHSTSPMNVEDYCESDNDSDTNESPDTVMETFANSPSIISTPTPTPITTTKSPIPPSADPQLLQKTLKDALRAASLQRQNVMQKKPRITHTPQKSQSSTKSRNNHNNHNQGSSSSASEISTANLEQLNALLPFMLQGLSGSNNNNIKNEIKDEISVTTDSTNRILYQMPQGVVYASKTSENPSRNNISNPFINQSSNNNNNSNDDNPLSQLFQFPIGLQQILATAALTQLAEAQASMKG
uniref:Uncharacterized protein n=1 Tax=Panagrolaimus davidi TaxID=227884 RepID=A0A914QKL8_9BILA